MKRQIVSLISGIIFGLGLAVSGMINPAKVLGFLDITGAWDPTLLMVMAAALGVTIVSFRWILRRSQPVCAEKFDLPAAKEITTRLVIGSILFGIGWGLVGFCPGPAIASLVFGLPKSFVFVLSMAVGMRVSQLF